MESEEGQKKLVFILWFFSFIFPNIQQELLEAHFSIKNGPRLVHLNDGMKDEMVLLMAKKKAKAIASSEWKQPISAGY